jgi:hypothetical protein
VLRVTLKTGRSTINEGVIMGIDALPNLFIRDQELEEVVEAGGSLDFDMLADNKFAWLAKHPRLDISQHLRLPG